ncbi:DUF2585 family protein [Coralliovum pocilloporae]|uniref:DUF2585 family protein n=1 Tax=Coralliovum pocilloporae TaxID=3066369 RepID=UPI003306C983
MFERKHFLAMSLLAVAGMIVILLWMGRSPICICGYVLLWSPDVMSSDNSQHIADWYTPSHIAHGFLFFGFFWLIGRSWAWELRLFLSVLIEAAWEIAENTNAVIERYREATIALDYYGDSVLNSFADLGFMVVGFWLAARLGLKWSIAVVLAMELAAAWVIRDNLTLNVIMLIHPLESIKAWQLAG